MKTFTQTIIRTESREFTFEVEAENEDEARKLIENLFYDEPFKNGNCFDAEDDYGDLEEVEWKQTKEVVK